MPFFIVLVGFNGAGKTTLAKKLENDLGLNIVSGDPLRRLITKEIKYWHDFDISIPTEKGRSTRSIIDNYRNDVSRTLLGLNQSVVYDSNALSKEWRANIFKKVLSKSVPVKKIILHVAVSEEELLQRLSERSEENWHEHYFKHKKPLFEKPEEDEADALLTYSQDNYKEVKSQVKELLG